MKPQEMLNPGEVNYLDLPDDQKVRVLSQAIAQGRLERSMAVYRAIHWLGRLFLKPKRDPNAAVNPVVGKMLADSQRIAV